MLKNYELETRCFLEESRNLCITTNCMGVKTKDYVTCFNKIKDYDTGEHELTIGNGRHKILNARINDWNNIKFINNNDIDRLVIPIETGQVIIESF